jgi:hypothetical protein
MEMDYGIQNNIQNKSFFSVLNKWLFVIKIIPLSLEWISEIKLEAIGLQNPLGELKLNKLIGIWPHKKLEINFNKLHHIG